MRFYVYIFHIWIISICISIDSNVMHVHFAKLYLYIYWTQYDAIANASLYKIQRIAINSQNHINSFHSHIFIIFIAYSTHWMDETHTSQHRTTIQCITFIRKNKIEIGFCYETNHFFDSIRYAIHQFVATAAWTWTLNIVYCTHNLIKIIIFFFVIVARFELDSLSILKPML